MNIFRRHLSFVYVQRERNTFSFNAEFLKYAIMQSHLCKCWTNEHETGKFDTKFMDLSQFDKVFLVSHVFMQKKNTQSILSVHMNLLLERQSLCAMSSKISIFF